MSKTSAFYYSHPEIILWRNMLTEAGIRGAGRIINYAVRYYMQHNDYLHIAAVCKSKLPIMSDPQILMVKYYDDVYEYLKNKKVNCHIEMSTMVATILKNGIVVVDDAKDEYLMSVKEINEQYINNMQPEPIVQREAQKHASVLKPETESIEIHEDDKVGNEDTEEAKANKQESGELADGIIDALMGDFGFR